MKRILSILILALLGMSLYAQTNPNRLLVRDRLGNVKGFLAERVDSVFFAREEGRIAADIQFKSYDPDAAIVTVSVTRTSGCQAFRIACVPTVNMSYLKDDASIANYFETKGGNMYYEDFSNGEMSGFEFNFKDNTSYSLITVGYDKYGIACSASRADFTTPRNPVVGNPQVEWEVTGAGTDYLSMKFTPNSDVSGYGICLFEKGEAQEQFEMFAPMFGFTNMGEMIIQFSGKLHDSAYETTWTELAPNTEYEVYIQPLDSKGTYADMIVASAATKAQGGPGTAEVSISIGDFGGDAENGYYQWVTFTPNDQVALFRGMLIEKAVFESPKWGEEKLVEYLKTDNPMDPYWDLYSTDEGQWNVDPGKDYIAFAIGRNINGEWGPLARKDFSTPAKAPASANAPAVCKKIRRDTSSYKKQGFKVIPAKHKSAGLKLTKSN